MINQEISAQVLSPSSVFDMDVKEQRTWTYLQRCREGVPVLGSRFGRLNLEELLCEVAA